jgi:hypothetical protein
MTHDRLVEASTPRSSATFKGMHIGHKRLQLVGQEAFCGRETFFRVLLICCSRVHIVVVTLHRRASSGWRNSAINVSHASRLHASTLVLESKAGGTT